MSKPRFQITAKYSLADLGDDWKNCYVEYRQLTYDDIEKLEGVDERSAKAVIKFVQDIFVSGKVPVNGQVVDMQKEDVRHLPIIVLAKIIEEASGTDPKGNTTSGN